MSNCREKYVAPSLFILKKLYINGLLGGTDLVFCFFLADQLSFRANQVVIKYLHIFGT
jgi:hypothetical protein